MGTPFDLTGATITMKMQNVNNAATVQVGSGTWTIASPATAGIASYAYGTSDVAVAGFWKLFITITLSNGKPIHATPKILEIDTAP